MDLTSKNVREIFLDCLAGTEDNPNLIKVEGVMNKVGLDKLKLEKYHNDIFDMLMQLPKEFRKTVGGGYSFLAGCRNKDDQQWGEHINVDELMMLGIGIGKAEIMLPRDLWKILPGGVPYFVVYDSND